MFRTSGKPVKRAHNQDSELPLPGIAEHRIETGTPSLAAADAYIGVLTGDFKAAQSGELTEVKKLVVNPLV
jgi:hypothetical protein